MYSKTVEFYVFMQFCDEVRDLNLKLDRSQNKNQHVANEKKLEYGVSVSWHSRLCFSNTILYGRFVSAQWLIQLCNDLNKKCWYKYMPDFS